MPIINKNIVDLEVNDIRRNPAYISDLQNGMRQEAI